MRPAVMRPVSHHDWRPRFRQFAPPLSRAHPRFERDYMLTSRRTKTNLAGQ
jgi:hypothetical protein